MCDETQPLDCSDTAAGVFGRMVKEEAAERLAVWAARTQGDLPTAFGARIEPRPKMLRITKHVVVERTKNPNIFLGNVIGQVSVVTGAFDAGTLKQIADALAKQLKQDILDWGELLAKENEEPEDGGETEETEGTEEPEPDETTDVLYGSNPAR